MQATIQLISGLPRSASTLLAALLRQNSRFEAGMSGPLAGVFGALLGEMSERNEFSVFLDDAKRQRILKGLFDPRICSSASPTMRSGAIRSACPSTCASFEVSA